MAASRPDPAAPEAPRAPRSRTSGTWVLVHLLLLPAVVVPLLVPLFDTDEPRLLGFPFFFWFQFALIPCAAVLTSAAFLLSRRAEKRGDRR